MTTTKNVLRSERLGRVIFTLVVLSLILAGILALLKGDFFYGNYWGGPVFAPLATAIGVFCLYLSVFHWRKLAQRPKRLKGRPARRAQLAAERKAIDDFDKPWTGE